MKSGIHALVKECRVRVCVKMSSLKYDQSRRDVHNSYAVKSRYQPCDLPGVNR